MNGIPDTKLTCNKLNQQYEQNVQANTLMTKGTSFLTVPANV